jgi:hypothetical protein
VVHTLLATAAHYAQWNALGVNPTNLTERDVAEEAAMLLAGLRARE